MQSFEELGLSPELVTAVKELEYETPTPIQLAAIPALLSGRDMIGQAQTGTGKTAAFALPIIQRIQKGTKTLQALVLAPTRELAMQVAEATTRLSGHSRVRTLAVYGGQPYSIQTRALERGVEMVVGTPGRLLDLIRQGILDLSQVRMLVLDEADEMLEMGFIEDVETILEQIPAERQMALFSATMPEAVRKLSERYLHDPLTISIDPKRRTVAETEQRYVRVREENKIEALSRLLEAEEVKSALIFARTKARAQDLADELIRRGQPAASLHGDLNQARREYVMDRFRRRDITLLVATDVAARGLDIDDVSHVFNYDLPGDAEDYVHRIGRTGRAGKKGIAITFVQPRERRKLGDIESYTRLNMQEIQVPGREEIQARRDVRFIERLTEQLGKGSISRERAIISKLEETSFDLVEIAATIIRMARAGEGELPAREINEPAGRPERRQGSDNTKGSQKGKPGREWKEEIAGHPRFDKHQREPGMVRLWMSLGENHGIRPGDVVGAIAGETGIPGQAIGEIDIRRECTFVDVAERHVRKVIGQGEAKYKLRGKPAMVRLAN